MINIKVYSYKVMAIFKSGLGMPETWIFNIKLE